MSFHIVFRYIKIDALSYAFKHSVLNNNTKVKYMSCCFMFGIRWKQSSDCCDGKMPPFPGWWIAGCRAVCSLSGLRHWFSFVLPFYYITEENVVFLPCTTPFQTLPLNSPLLCCVWIALVSRL